MNKTLRILLALCLATAINAVGQSHHYHLPLADFNELVVLDAINVEYRCDPARAGLIEFESDWDCVSSVVFENNKGKLTVQLAERNEKTPGLPTVLIYSSYLTKVTNEGDSLLRVVTIAPQGKLTARLVGNGRLQIDDIEVTALDAAIVSGNGTMTLVGKAPNARLAITGTGHIEAAGLNTSDANCSITGTGAITVDVADKLTASGLGSGNIYYIGSPKINKKFLATVKVNPYQP
ncbi:MAG: DUF2807 domain-containing protein [Paramuribaculum sp.]|nr:DUF2807 domain-containing protein [Paramuribaculum sp.]